MKALSPKAFWLLEVVLVVAFFLLLAVPIQDYAMREFKEYVRHPSPQTLKAFGDKKQEETRLRQGMAVLIALVAVGVAIPIFWDRRGSRGR